MDQLPIKLLYLALIIFSIFLMVSLFTLDNRNVSSQTPERFFQIQSIDTMKFSRDVAREKMDDETYDVEIDTQVRSIAETGATHVAIATPYDEEFVPFLKRWVAAAREHDLKVWFRGNLSGWEGWFDYEKIDRNEHIRLVEEFILENPDLFEDDDVFVSCPECENGGPGDPRMNGDLAGHRAFLIEEHETVITAFDQIGKNVQVGFYSMNGDVAELVMDRETTKALGGIVTIDHYVASTDRLIEDIRRIHQKSGGQIMLGEFGAPIPDIHGAMSPEEQSEWIRAAMEKLAAERSVIGVNYWVSKGGSTEIWTSDNEPRPTVGVLRSFFSPRILSGQVVRPSGRPIGDIKLQTPYVEVVSAQDGTFQIPIVAAEEITITKSNFESKTFNADNISSGQIIIVEQIERSFTDSFLDLIHRILPI